MRSPFWGHIQRPTLSLFFATALFACGPQYVDVAYDSLVIELLSAKDVEGDAEPFRGVERMEVQLEFFEDLAAEIPYGSRSELEGLESTLIREFAGAPQHIDFKEDPIVLPRLSENQGAIYLRVKLRGLDSAGKVRGRASCPVLTLSRGSGTVKCRAWFGAVGEWAPLRASPEGGRRLFASLVLPDGRVLVAGGQSLGPQPQALDSVEIFDPLSNKWTLLEKGLSEARYELSAVLTRNGLVSFVGGRTGEGAQELSRAVDVLDIDTLVWNSTRELGAPRSGHAAVSMGESVLIAGGLGVDGAAIETAEEFFPSSGLSVNRESHGARIQPCLVAVDEGKALLCGGGNVEGDALRGCVLFGGSQNISLESTMRVPRKNAQCSALGGRAFIAGGSRDLVNPGLVELWSDGVVTDVGNLPQDLEGHAMASAGDWVLVVGGHRVGSPSSVSDAVFAIDTAHYDELKTLKSLPEKRTEGQLLSLEGGHLLLIGGHDGGKSGNPKPMIMTLAE